MNTQNIKSINNENKTFILKINSNYFQNTFLSSCFKYYYGNTNIIKDDKNLKLQYSKTFFEIKKYNKIIIIDYANIIHILFEKYKTINSVSIHFYKFITKHLKENNKIIIVSKIVSLNGNNYDILKFLNIGKYLTKKSIKPHYFLSEQLCIYNLNYKNKLSSSIDDLLQYFLTFVIFVYLLNNNKDPSYVSDDKILQKLVLITNDKQMFDKNLFGKTIDEKNAHIKYLKDLIYKKVSINNNEEYIFIDNDLEQLLLRDFFNNYMKENIKDVEHLECNLSVLLELLQKNKKICGYFRQNKFPEYNYNFKKKNYTRTIIPNFSYNNLNRTQKKYNKYMKICKSNKSIERNKNLKYNYYLYVFIKYIQLYQNTLEYDGNLYGDFFGNFTKETILKIFT